MKTLHDRLAAFQKANRFHGKGPLAVALVVTHRAKDLTFPLEPGAMLAGSKGQVAGLGKATVQSILKAHNILKELAKEGGRTSRGSVRNMETYVELLNQLHGDKLIDLDEIEKWWVARVQDYFNTKGFTLRFDPAKSMQYIVQDVLAQALKKQKEATGTTYVGTVLQHLVGAKLSLMLGSEAVASHGASVADEASGRGGDFVIEDVCVHVTTTPTDSLMSKCAENLNSGFRPVVVTTTDGLAAAQSSAKLAQIEQRVDIIEAGQFIATNLYEWSKFKPANRKLTVEKLIASYNEIIDASETDPSLKITLGV